jgi:hypothetical protein
MCITNILRLSNHVFVSTAQPHVLLHLQTQEESAKMLKKQAILFSHHSHESTFEDSNVSNDTSYKTGWLVAIYIVYLAGYRANKMS